MSPLKYFTAFFNDELVDLVVHNSNLYSVQREGKSNTNSNEMKTFIGMHILMGIY